MASDDVVDLVRVLGDLGVGVLVLHSHDLDCVDARERPEQLLAHEAAVDQRLLRAVDALQRVLLVARGLPLPAEVAHQAVCRARRQLLGVLWVEPDRRHVVRVAVSVVQRHLELPEVPEDDLRVAARADQLLIRVDGVERLALVLELCDGGAGPAVPELDGLVLGGAEDDMRKLLVVTDTCVPQGVDLVCVALLEGAQDLRDGQVAGLEREVAVCYGHFCREEGRAVV